MFVIILSIIGKSKQSFITEMHEKNDLCHSEKKIMMKGKNSGFLRAVSPCSKHFPFDPAVVNMYQTP